MDVKITTYNIHSCIGTDNLYSTDRIASVIKNNQPDIVCLQEVEVNDDDIIPTKTRVWSKHHGDDQPELIASKAGLEYYVFVPAIRSKADSNWKERHQYVSDLHVSGNIVLPTDHSREECKSLERQHLHHAIESTTGKFGLAILSNLPILSIRTHYYKRYKKKTQRNAMACLIKLPNKNLVWVVNTHLGCHCIGQEQGQQAKELLLFIHSLERKTEICGVIVCGDFNSPPWYSCITELKHQGLRDVWQTSRGRLCGTFPSHEQVVGMPKFLRCFRKLLRLDYIFLTDRIICKIAYVCDDCSDASLASDHLPLCAVLFVDNKR
jgi:endonuclease/exonuclease/phosphatase family metal-dependent hydrolase